jgi:hypothetical protein
VTVQDEFYIEIDYVSPPPPKKKGSLDRLSKLYGYSGMVISANTSCIILLDMM